MDENRGCIQLRFTHPRIPRGVPVGDILALTSPKGTPLSNRGYMSEANAPPEDNQSKENSDPERVAHHQPIWHIRNLSITLSGEQRKEAIPFLPPMIVNYMLISMDIATITIVRYIELTVCQTTYTFYYPCHPLSR